jgi:hypothetical protein
VLVNGKQVNAILDTGAPTSIISLSAANGAGVNPTQDRTKSAGKVTGLAGNPIEAWIGTFGMFALGDESVRNVKLQIADLFTADTQETTGSHIRQHVEGLPEMLVGADFFRTHRILVLFAEHKLVFTYNGGPIFQTIEPDAAAQTGGSADTGKAEPPQRVEMYLARRSRTRGGKPITSSHIARAALTKSITNLPAHSTCNNYRWDYLPEEFQYILKLGVWASTQMIAPESPLTGMRSSMRKILSSWTTSRAAIAMTSGSA